MASSFLAAVLALGLLTVLPGPDVAIVTRVALGPDRSQVLRVALGVASGLLVWGLLTVAGLSALLAASSVAYTVVKVAGAVYLVVLGLQTLLRSGRVDPSPPTSSERAEPAERGWRLGFMSNLFNPKIAVFYTGVLPQLVPEGAPHAATLVVLVVVHAVVSVAWLTLYGTLLGRASGAIRRPSMRRWLDRVTGAVLVGFGVRVWVSAGDAGR